jgi:DNA-binding LacI/PurR family transcriptional regulator
MTLNVDYRHGIWQGVQHLAVLGHRKVAFISGPLNLHTARLRQQAFTESLEQVGLQANPVWLIEGDHTLDGGMNAMQQLLQCNDSPTAILCSNDMTAIGVMHAILGAGRRIPDDFSVIGFDDVYIAQFTFPPLTTIRMSCLDLARGAVAVLCPDPKAQPPAAEKTNAMIPTELIVRRTTSIPRGTIQTLKPQGRPASSEA